jgi:hypothetical protein
VLEVALVEQAYFASGVRELERDGQAGDAAPDDDNVAIGSRPAPGRHAPYACHT